MNGIDPKLILNALALLSQNSDLLNKFVQSLDMPNIPLPTLGGHVFWTTLAEYNGLKLQTNMITHHARILDKDNVRIAWGSVEAMDRALTRIVDFANRYNS